jgi:hypothetical protein
MYSQKQTAVVLYTVSRSSSREPGFLRHESDAGIMSEVDRVTGALQELGAPYRTVGIRRLSDLHQHLAGTADRLILNLVEGLEAASGASIWDQRWLGRPARAVQEVMWKATGCQDYARIDFRTDHEGHPFVLEVNAQSRHWSRLGLRG